MNITPTELEDLEIQCEQCNEKHSHKVIHV